MAVRVLFQFGSLASAIADFHVRRLTHGGADWVLSQHPRRRGTVLASRSWSSIACRIRGSTGSRLAFSCCRGPPPNHALHPQLPLPLSVQCLISFRLSFLRSTRPASGSGVSLVVRHLRQFRQPVPVSCGLASFAVRFIHKPEVRSSAAVSPEDDEAAMIYAPVVGDDLL